MKNAVITGGSKGIGKAIATLFAQKGFTVTITGRNEDSLKEAVTSLEGDGHSYVVGDVSSEESAKKLRDTVSSVDVLVNNAGFGIFKNVEDLSKDEFEDQLAVNVTGVFLTTKYLLPLFKEQNKGSIITISSMAAQSSFAGGTAYTATKWGVEGFMGSLKKELRDTKVKCGTVLPGSVDTHFFDDLPFGPTPDRHLDAEDVARTVYFMATQPETADIDRIVLRPAKRDV